MTEYHRWEFSTRVQNSISHFGSDTTVTAWHNSCTFSITLYLIILVYTEITLSNGTYSWWTVIMLPYRYCGLSQTKARNKIILQDVLFLREFRLPSRCKWDFHSFFLSTWPVKMRPISYLETSVTTNQRCVTCQKSEDIVVVCLLCSLSVRHTYSSRLMCKLDSPSNSEHNLCW